MSQEFDSAVLDLVKQKKIISCEYMHRFNEHYLAEISFLVHWFVLKMQCFRRFRNRCLENYGLCPN